MTRPHGRSGRGARRRRDPVQSLSKIGAEPADGFAPAVEADLDRSQFSKVRVGKGTVRSVVARTGEKWRAEQRADMLDPNLRAHAFERRKRRCHNRVARKRKPQREIKAAGNGRIEEQLGVQNLGKYSLDSCAQAREARDDDGDRTRPVAGQQRGGPFGGGPNLSVAIGAGHDPLDGWLRGRILVDLVDRNAGALEGFEEALLLRGVFLEARQQKRSAAVDPEMRVLRSKAVGQQGAVGPVARAQLFPVEPLPGEEGTGVGCGLPLAVGKGADPSVQQLPGDDGAGSRRTGVHKVFARLNRFDDLLPDQELLGRGQQKGRRFSAVGQLPRKGLPTPGKPGVPG